MEMVLSNDVMLASTLSVQFFLWLHLSYIDLPQVCGDTGCGKSTQATIGRRDVDDVFISMVQGLPNTTPLGATVPL